MLISLEEAAALLCSDRVVALPTETVYGLAASIYSKKAVQKVYSLKNRPSDNPLITHVRLREELAPFLAEELEDLDKLGGVFWPGPLTVVVPVNETFPSYVRAGLSKAAFRIPSHPLIQEVLKLSGPLAMPSANLSGRPSATTAKHVEEDFSLSFPVLDGGSCEKGVESTVLIFDEKKWWLGRLGSISLEEIGNVLGYLPVEKVANRPLCPGQKYRHYAPKCSLLLAKGLSSCEAVLGFEERTYPESALFFSLGSLKDPEHVCYNLYANLRSLDQNGIATCFVDMDFPKHGLWKTIQERLEKAASTS